MKISSNTTCQIVTLYSSPNTAHALTLASFPGLPHFSSSVCVQCIILNANQRTRTGEAWERGYTYPCSFEAEFEILPACVQWVHRNIMCHNVLCVRNPWNFNLWPLLLSSLSQNTIVSVRSITVVYEEEGYLLPTWARKITCQRFDWMLQSSSEWQLEHSVKTSASYFLSSSRQWITFIYAGANWEATEGISLYMYKMCNSCDILFLMLQSWQKYTKNITV